MIREMAAREGKSRITGPRSGKEESSMRIGQTETMLERRKFFATIASFLPVFLAVPHLHRAQDNSGFPDGYDAVQAAPNSHKVIFENALVRLLEVTVPPGGVTEPMHHHRWPSFFLNWDTGGKTPHVRYHAGDGSVRDEPSREGPIHPGVWHVQWMKPEPMHSIEVVENPRNAGSSQNPPLLRVEIKCSQYPGIPGTYTVGP